MNSEENGYVPLKLANALKRQSFKVWAVALAAVFLWVMLIIAAPAAKIEGSPGISGGLYHFFGYLCHQIPERSFHLGGEPFAVCSRCFGVYLGLVIGIAVYPLWRPIATIEPLPRVWLFLSLIPMVVDWSLTFFGVWDNTHLSRLATGLILGFACATYIVPALVEVTRNVTYRSLHSRQ